MLNAARSRMMELPPLARRLVLLSLVVGASIGLGYCAPGQGKTVTCEDYMLGKAGVCHPPEDHDDSYYVCPAASRDEVREDDCTHKYQ
jgi:hypothetical protein